MKTKIQLNKGLTLNKEVITKLQDNQMAKVKGGAAPGASCGFLSCNRTKAVQSI